MTPATLTTAEFLLAHPEFARCVASKVTAAVAEGNRIVDADVYDPDSLGVANDAAGWWAAYLIASSKFGVDAGLDPVKYLAAFRGIGETCVGGPLLPDLEAT